MSEMRQAVGVINRRGNVKSFHKMQTIASQSEIQK
jgi:hypothetical protein